MPATSNLRPVLVAYLALSLVLSSIWQLLPTVEPRGLIVLILALVAIWKIPGDGIGFASPSSRWLPERQQGSGGFESLVVSALAMAPALAVLIVSWRQEFPFIGDHDFHTIMAAISAEFFGWGYGIALISMIVFAFWAIRFDRLSKSLRVALPALGFLLMFGLIFTVGTDPTFATRYPGALHFLIFPIRKLVLALDGSAPLNANRLTCFLAIPGWLWILRPLFLRRRPEWSILPFCFLYFWQKDVAYYFSAAYLEPWAVMLIVTAAELVVRHRERFRITAGLLIGFASLFKEQAIFMLPFVYLFSLRTEERHWRRLIPLAAVGAVSIAPFYLYYMLRKRTGVWRDAGVGDWKSWISPERFTEFGDRAVLQFGSLFLILLAVGVFWGLWRRRSSAFLLSAAAFQVVFFFGDRISADWTGYPRFHLIPLALLSLLSIPLLESQRRKGRFVMAVSMVALIANGIPYAGFFQASTGSGAGRNFFEHYDTPVALPISRTLQKAEQEGVLEATQIVRLLAPGLSTLNPGSGSFPNAPVVYPELAQRHGLRVQRVFVPGECSCHGAGDGVLAVRIRFAYLGAKLPLRPAAESAEMDCIRRLKETCTAVSEYFEDGQLLGVFGKTGR